LSSNQFISYGVKGLLRIAKLGLIDANMDDIVRTRLKILAHWHKFGLASTMHAFGNSKSTLYAWRKLLKGAGGNTVALKPASTRPKKLRAAAWNPQIVSELARLRKLYPNLGKEKVFAKLVPFCQQQELALPSVSTIGRMIASAPHKLRSSAVHINAKGQRKRFTKEAVTRKPKGVVLKPLECLAFDTIIRQRDGIKRYILTAIDPHTHIAFAYAPPSAGSQHTAMLHQAITHIFPDFEGAKALTDNGSEFKGHFAQRMADNHVVHWKTYPKTPKMNAHCERFNRSIQESFVDYFDDLLFTDLALFNQKMSDWLVFYNTELPHLSTKPFPNKSASLTNLPVSPVEFLLKSHPQSRMCWTNTKACWLCAGVAQYPQQSHTRCGRHKMRRQTWFVRSVSWRCAVLPTADRSVRASLNLGASSHRL
jgi:transposase InsO family protein